MKKIVIKLVVICMVICSILTTKTDDYNAKTLDGKMPIEPAQYQKILGKGMDVDWSKTKKGRETYSEKVVKDFKKAGISHVRIRIKDEISISYLRIWTNR